MYGHMGNILRINLTDKTYSIEPLDEQMARQYIGGSGFGTKILWDEVGPEVKPYDPENKLIFATGPLSGTLLPAAGRFNIVTKSPLTGGYGSSSLGGFWGPEMKAAGYDAIIVEGCAETPVYIWIDDDKIEIRDAKHIWGHNVWETEELLKEELCDMSVEVLSIGPAGENLVLGACTVVNRARIGGWGGNGPVMGSKKLKAIAVRGSKSVRFADPDEYIRLNNEIIKEIWESPTLRDFTLTGMPYLTKYNQGPSVGGMPTGSNCCFNWQVAHIPEDKYENCTVEHILETQYVKSKACFGCPVHCSHWFKIEDGKYASTQGEGFEFNTVGECCKMGVFNSDFMTKLTNTVNTLGLDIDTPCCSIAWAMECYQRGIITKEDTGGLELHWGDEDLILKLLHMIANREGFGDVLANGTAKAAEYIGRGSERYALIGRGGCEARWDHRWAYGWALGQAVATRGPDHLSGCSSIEYSDSRELEAKLGLPEKSLDCESTEGKGELTVHNERVHSLADAVTMCKFVTLMNHTSIETDHWARLISCTTGWDMTRDELNTAADRINLLQKCFNVRCGIGTREHDFLPTRMHEDPIETTIPIIPRDVLENMKDDYYEARGWEVESGLPLRTTMEKYGLYKVADELESFLGRKL